MPILTAILQRKSSNVSVTVTRSGCLHCLSVTAITTVAPPVMRSCGTYVFVVHQLLPPGHWWSRLLAWLPPPALFSSAPAHHIASSHPPCAFSCRLCSHWLSPSFSPTLTNQHLTGNIGTVLAENRAGQALTWRKCNRLVVQGI